MAGLFGPGLSRDEHFSVIGTFRRLNSSLNIRNLFYFSVSNNALNIRTGAFSASSAFSNSASAAFAFVSSSMRHSSSSKHFNSF